MQKPGGEAPPQFRPGPPTPTPSAPPAGPMPPGLGPRPRMMNMGRPYAPPAMHGQGPMMPPRPPFVPGGHQQQQQSPRFGPPHPPSSMLSSPPGNTVPPPFGQSMPSAAPPSPNMMSSSAPSPPPPGAMAMPLRPPRGPPPPGPQQPQFPPPPGAPNIPPPPNHHAPPSSASAQGPRLVANASASLPSEPIKPTDDEVVRNIEVLTHFVIKNGPNFENMARAKQAGDPKFSFLFGGGPGSDAAIGQEYYHWFKMKSRMEQKVGREGEAKAQQAVLPGSVDPNQEPEDSNVVSSKGPLPVSAVSDMEMDMDMEDDMVVPRLITDDGRNFQATENKEELQSSANHQEAKHREALDCQVKSLVAAGRSQNEVSKLEFQKEKGAVCFKIKSLLNFERHNQSKRSGLSNWSRLLCFIPLCTVLLRWDGDMDLHYAVGVGTYTNDVLRHGFYFMLFNLPYLFTVLDVKVTHTLLLIDLSKKLCLQPSIGN